MLKQISLFALVGLLLFSAGCNKKAQTSGETGYRDEDLIITSDQYDLPATLCIPDGASCYMIETLVTYMGQMTMRTVEY